MRLVMVEQGTNYLACTGLVAILSMYMEIMPGRGKKGTVPPLWDGRAVERIADTPPRQETPESER